MAFVEPLRILLGPDLLADEVDAMFTSPLVGFGVGGRNQRAYGTLWPLADDRVLRVLSLSGTAVHDQLVCQQIGS